MRIKQTILAVMLAWGGQACMGQAIAPEVISSSELKGMMSTMNQAQASIK